MEEYHEVDFKKEIFTKWKNRYLLMQILTYLSKSDKMLIVFTNKLINKLLPPEKNQFSDISKMKRKFIGFINSRDKRIRSNVKYDFNRFISDLLGKFDFLKKNFSFMSKYFFSRWINQHLFKFETFNLSSNKLSEHTKEILKDSLASNNVIRKITILNCNFNSQDLDTIKKSLSTNGSQIYFLKSK